MTSMGLQWPRAGGRSGLQEEQRSTNFTKHSQAAKQDGVQAGKQEAGQADFNSKGLAAILVEVQGWIQAWSNRPLRCGLHRHWSWSATILISVRLLWDSACEMKAL